MNFSAKHIKLCAFFGGEKIDSVWRNIEFLNYLLEFLSA